MKLRATNLNILVDKVLQAYEEYDSKTLDGIWGQLYACWRATLHNRGGFDYTLPHEGGRSRFDQFGTAVDRHIDVEQFNACFDIVYGNN